MLLPIKYKKLKEKIRHIDSFLCDKFPVDYTSQF